MFVYAVPIATNTFVNGATGALGRWILRAARPASRGPARRWPPSVGECASREGNPGSVHADARPARKGRPEARATRSIVRRWTGLLDSSPRSSPATCPRRCRRPSTYSPTTPASGSSPAASPVDDIDAAKLLAAVDAYLMQWKAHGHPLTAARDWRDDRFLAIGVDQRTRRGIRVLDRRTLPHAPGSRARGGLLAGRRRPRVLPRAGRSGLLALARRFRGACPPRRRRWRDARVRHDDHQRRRLSRALRDRRGRELAQGRCSAAHRSAGVRRRRRLTSAAGASASTCASSSRWAALEVGGARGQVAGRAAERRPAHPIVPAPVERRGDVAGLGRVRDPSRLAVADEFVDAADRACPSPAGRTPSPRPARTASPPRGTASRSRPTRRTRRACRRVRGASVTRSPGTP